MGWMDRTSVNNFISCERHNDLRHEENAGQQEGAKEQDSRECGNEWREFLQPWL